MSGLATTAASPRTAGQAAPGVVLEGVHKAYGGRPVVDGVTLEVVAGSILVLLGPSGAGKTTILRLVAGLDVPDSGTISIGSDRVAGGGAAVPPERRGVGMVFQSLELWPHMTVAENVAFGLPGRPRGERARRAPRVLEVAADVGLPADLLTRRPPTLSGGERQRVAIARALAPGPRVLLYDEPLAHLDPERRGEIRSLVRALRARAAATVLYVTHDAAEALEVGDEIAVLVAGRVVERGRPADLYARPRTIEGARALGPVSILPARRTSGGGRGATFETPLGVFEVPDGPPAGDARVLVRPEQVEPADEGVPARVDDAHPVAGGYAFAARVGGDGLVVFGRSRGPLVPGTSIRLRVTGAPAAVPAGEPGPGRRSP